MTLALDMMRDQTVAVLGLGGSGREAARALLQGGARLLAWDDGLDARVAAEAAGFPLLDPAQWPWERLSAVVMAPGIPLTHPAPHPVAIKAATCGVPVLGDIELLGRACPDATYVGITGTNGKSTTTALLAHLLQTAGRAVAVGGNLGPAALGLPRLQADGIYVLEMSSYQLDLTLDLRFQVAVQTNISPDHLDRHGGLEGYVTAKRRLFRAPAAGQTAVVGVDDPHGETLAADLEKDGQHTLVPISGRTAGPGVRTLDGWVYEDGVAMADLRAIPTLPGRHNGQNAAAAWAAARAVGVPADILRAGLASFPGLAHRQERVAVVDGIVYVNDSKATNAEAAAPALDSYDSVFWIAGGRPKEGGIDALADRFGRIRHAFLIGEAALAFARTLENHGVPFNQCGDLAAAVAAARAHALEHGGPGSVVLLSPACASFDQFRSFEARGDAFRHLVAALPGNRHDPWAPAPDRGGAA